MKDDIKWPPLQMPAGISGRLTSSQIEVMREFVRKEQAKAVLLDRQQRSTMPGEPFAIVTDRMWAGEGHNLAIWDGTHYQFSDGDCYDRDGDTLDDCAVQWLTHYQLEQRLFADRQQRGGPAAFSYELATTRSADGEYTHWSPRLSHSMPNVPADSIRNLQCLYAAPQPTPALSMNKEFSQFLADVMTAAGLVSHGKQCKALGERLSQGCMRLRSNLATPAQEPIGMLERHESVELAFWSDDAKTSELPAGDYPLYISPQAAPAQEPDAPDTKHPIQPLVADEHGALRFKKNAIVNYLLDNGPFDMNHLARVSFTQEDREQFAQLIGYSLVGFGTLSYVSDETFNRAMPLQNGGKA